MNLESQYRRAMAWYPQRWLARNGDDMLSTLLDVAGDRENVPSRERIGLRLRGLATRLGISALLVPSVARDRAASVAFATGFAFSVAGVVFGESRCWAIEDRLDRAGYWSQHGFGPFTSTGIILYGLWMVALVTMLLGLHRATRALLIVTIPTIFVTGIVNEHFHMWARPDPDATLPLLAFCAIIAASGRLERRITVTLTAAITAGVLGLNALVYAISLSLAGYSGFGSSQDFSFGPISWVNLAVTVGAIAAARRLRAHGQRAWSTGIAVGAAGWYWLAYQWLSQNVLLYLGDAASFLLYAVVAIVVVLFVLRAKGIRVRLTLTRKSTD